LEVLSLYHIYMAFQKIVPSLHDECLTCIYAPIWDENCNMLRYENEYLKFVPSLHDECLTCICAPIWDETCNMLRYENKYLKFIPSSYDKCMICKFPQEYNNSRSAEYYENKLFKLILSLYKKFKAYYCSQEGGKAYKFRNKMPLNRCFNHFHSCSIFLIISECNNLEYSFHHSIMKKHDFAVYWLEYYLIYISVSIIFSHCILTRKKKQRED
jgi:hypothetical protein